jgi:uncharacterized protein (DUF1810 family)
VTEGRDHAGDRADPYDLERFVVAQRTTFSQALAELRRGRKESHWIWFVFPQIAGLGRSATAAHYAITTTDEARAYLAHPVLGPRLLEAAQVVADVDARNAESLLGTIDAVKVRSSMTLFARVADDPAPFRAVLERWYDGREDPATVSLLPY